MNDEAARHLAPGRVGAVLRILSGSRTSSDAPGFRLHPLKGARAGEWSANVSGNWRVVFRFEDGEAVDVDLVDYH